MSTTNPAAISCISTPLRTSRKKGKAAAGPPWLSQFPQEEDQQDADEIQAPNWPRPTNAMNLSLKYLRLNKRNLSTIS
jgi:hypothetical protein